MLPKPELAYFAIADISGYTNARPSFDVKYTIVVA
jgi:hypothetical protein